MAGAPPSGPSIRSRKRSTFWRPARDPPQPGIDPGGVGGSGSGGLDIIAQRFLLGLEFPDPPFDYVADRNQADNPAVLDHRQMPEFAQRHHFHDRADGIALLAADHLARHHRTDRFFEHRRAAFAEHADDVAFRQDAFDAALAHRQHGADLPLRQNLDRRRELGVGFDALD